MAAREQMVTAKLKTRADTQLLPASKGMLPVREYRVQCAGVFMEVDATQLPLPRPCPITATRCRLCGQLLTLGGYYEIGSWCW
jgi:hypothetical protein